MSGISRRRTVAAVVLAAWAAWASAAPPTTRPAETPCGWLALPKDVPLGPGSFSADLELRSRYEWLDNFTVKRYGTDQRDDLLLFRAQLGLEYRLKLPDGQPPPRFYVQFQDARHWLSDLDRHQFTETCSFFDQFDLRQAFIEWRRIGNSPVGFQLGRQNIAYADNRVFGPGQWGNVGRYWWDAARLILETEPVQVDFLYGRRIISEQVEFNDRHYDFDMLGAYAQVKNLPFRLDLFYVLRCDDHGEVSGESGRGDERRHSVGAYVDGRCGRWDWGGTGVWQFGDYVRDEICAWGANTRIGYTFEHPWKPRLGAEFSYASGDDDPRDGRQGTFDGVFGAIDSYYGRMNFVSWKNLEDYELSASVQPARGLKLRADWHLFRLASDNDSWYWCSGGTMRRDPSGRSGRTLGTELDVIVTWQICPRLELMAGYSHFFPGAFIKNTGSDDHADWVFCQLTWRL